MILYHFMSEKYALSAIENQKLKVSRFGNLNDPFELLAAGSGQKIIREGLKSYAESMAKRIRLLCCSKNWESPVLWGHYADSHKGIALALEVPDNIVHEVVYVEERMEVSLENLQESVVPGDFGLRMLTTKYKEWEYENEARILLNPEYLEESEGLDFYKCGKEFQIVGVVRAPLNNTSEEDIACLIPENKSLWVTKARLAFKSYQVVPDKRCEKKIINSTKYSV